MIKRLLFPAMTICMCAILLTSCGAGLSKVEGTATELPRTIDPFDFSDEFVSVSPQKQDDKTVPREIPSNDTPVDESEPTSPEITDTQEGVTAQTAPLQTVTSRGYRVQVGAFEDKENAERMKEYVSINFKQPVYLEYQPPFYRVRMGDYTDLYQAESYVEILRSKGFKDARWVPSTINVPQ